MLDSMLVMSSSGGKGHLTTPTDVVVGAGATVTLNIPSDNFVLFLKTNLNDACYTAVCIDGEITTYGSTSIATVTYNNGVVSITSHSSSSRPYCYTYIE